MKIGNGCSIKKKAYMEDRRQRNRAFVDEIRARTVCEKCGARPIDWHREIHVQHPGWRVNRLRDSQCSLARIQAEIEACQPLCRRCHLITDGRMEMLRGRMETILNKQRNARLGDSGVTKTCAACEKPTQRIRNRMCSRCYQRSIQKLTGGWIVAIYWHKDGVEQQYAFIHKYCYGNDLGVCTTRPDRMKRWRTKAGADRAARTYERNNPGCRCEPEPRHAAGMRIETDFSGLMA